jgi:hypothetical protein
VIVPLIWLRALIGTGVSLRVGQAYEHTTSESRHR